MSSVAKFIGTVAGIAALIPGPHQPIAAAVAVAANVTAQLTAKKPPAMTGSVNRVSIGANQPKPYLIGETYYGGNRINHEGFGGKVSKVNNPYMVLVDVYSGAGPIAGFVAPYLDFVPVTLNGNAATGYAANHLYVYHQLGRTPEPAALSTHWNGAQTWGPQHKLSSFAAISWCLRFDEDGKRFAAGTPQTGAVWRGVLAYDPRKDSTYPGGSGPHRWASPTDKVAFAAAKATWEWSRCPGLQGLRYALGTWERDENNPEATYRKTFGIGIPIDGIRVADFVALANVCDANGWHVDGVIHEPGKRDDNLKNILVAGGAERCWIGGKLGLKLSAPRVALDTITEYDLATDDVEIGAMQGWESRLNTIIPKYRSADHKWEYVPSTAVTIASYLAEDGEEKAEERQYNLVQSKDQAAQLAAYELLDARELGEIVLTCKPRLRRYGAGDLLIVHLPDDGLVNQPCVVLKRTFDPVSMTVELILRGETAAKHDFALGRTGTAPATPHLTGGEIFDDVAVDTRLVGSNGTNGADAPLLITQWSIDGATNWHNEYQVGDRYFRMSNDGGNVFGPAVLAVGEDGTDGVRGADGGYVDTVFRYSSAVPATPIGVSPAEWYDGPAVTQIAGRVSTGRDDYISGDQWLRVQPGETYRVIGGLNATLANAAGALGLNFASNPADGTTFNWIAAGSIPAGQAGAIDGYIVVPPGMTYMRPWAQIDAIENFGQIDYHFRLNDLPPLFMSRAKRNADGSLAGAWSPPVRISGEDGKETLSAFLTNESFSHPTDAQGAPTAITSGAGDGQMKVFLGSRDITSLCTFTVQQPFWLGITVDAAGNYSSNYLGNDTGYAFVIAAFQGRAIAKQLNATRSKNGTTVAIQASAQAIETLNGALVTNSPVTFMAKRGGTDTTAIEWRVFDGAGTQHRYFYDANGSGYFTDMADLLAIINYPHLAQGKANTRFCTVRADCAGATDTVTVIAIARGKDGRDGVDGVPGVNGADGTTWYPYFAYANSPDGSIDFTTGAPNGRSYVGFATGTSPTEPQSAGFYTWSAYRGPAFGLTGTNVAIAGDQIIMTASGGWGTSGAYSTTGFRGGAIATFRAGDGHAGDIMAGLNSDPATNDSYDTIDYCWYLHSNGHAYVFESGGHVAVDIPGFGLGIFNVEYDNRVIRYVYNGVVYHEHAVAADQTLYFDAALAGNAGVSRLSNVAFASVGRAGGDGIPGTNGTNGQAGRDGRDGQTSFVHYAYADSADGHANFTTGSADGRSFVGVYVDFSEPDSGNPDAYQWTRLRGLDGNNGLPGKADTDGRTPYVHTAYANSPDGSVDFTTDDAQALARRYIGLRTDYEVADLQDPGGYVWSLSRGADGVSPFALELGSAAIVLNATYAGVTKPGQLPRNVAVSVKQGTTDAIGAVAIGINTSAGIVASYAGGVVSITTADADGYVEVSATQGGVNVAAPKRISISRSLDAPPPQTATGVTQRGYNGDPNNTSYFAGPSGKIVTVAVPANGSLPIEIYLEYSVLENQSFAFRTYAVAAKIMYRPVGSGGAWSDLISEVTGTIASWSRSTQEYTQGELNYPSSVTLPGGQTFEFALLIRKQSGNGSAQYVDGFMRIGE